MESPVDPVETELECLVEKSFKRYETLIATLNWLIARTEQINARQRARIEEAEISIEIAKRFLDNSPPE